MQQSDEWRISIGRQLSSGVWHNTIPYWLLVWSLQGCSNLVSFTNIKRNRFVRTKRSYYYSEEHMSTHWAHVTRKHTHMCMHTRPQEHPYRICFVFSINLYLTRWSHFDHEIAFSRRSWPRHQQYSQTTWLIFLQGVPGCRGWSCWATAGGR